MTNYKKGDKLKVERNGVEWECVVTHEDKVRQGWRSSPDRTLLDIYELQIRAISQIDGKEIIFRNGVSEDGIKIINND